VYTYSAPSGIWFPANNLETITFCVFSKAQNKKEILDFDQVWLYFKKAIKHFIFISLLFIIQ